MSRGMIYAGDLEKHRPGGAPGLAVLAGRAQAVQSLTVPPRGGEGGLQGPYPVTCLPCPGSVPAWGL